MKGLISFAKAILAAIISLVMSIVAIVNPEIPPFAPGEILNPVKPEVEMMTLIENKETDYIIVFGENASESEKNAASTLQMYLEQISAVKVAVVADSTAQTGKEIIVGKTNREGSEYQIDRAALGDEGFNIKTCGDRLIIAGGEVRGTLYGVYTFLEEYLDCHWYTNTLKVIPKNSKVEIPKVIDEKQIPNLEYRETDWISPHDVTYSIANKLNGSNYRYLSPENGGMVGYTGPLCHTLSNTIVAPEKYFADHPEYYALTDEKGKREPQQLCLTNPEVLRIATQEVFDILEKNPDAKIISLTQHDNGDYCVCPNCKAVDDYEEAHSGTMIRFVNAVADAVKDKYPNVAIDTFAYQYTRKAPLHVVPRENVIVRLCSIECCFSHPLNECKENESFTKDLKDWKQLSNRLYIWDYTTNYNNYSAPFCNFGVMQENMQFFVENGVAGIYEEGNYQAIQVNTEFSDLRSYLLSKLMWNPYLDYDKEMNGFLKAYYGEGWQYIREFIMQTIDKTGNKGTHMKIFEGMKSDAILDLTENEREYIDDLWEKAKANASNDYYLKNVERSELCWRYWKACKKVDEFSRITNPTGWKNENKTFYNDLKSFGVVRVAEVKLLSDNPDFRKTPEDWGVKG